MRIILASKSPRRVDILRQVGVNFEVMPANIDESVNSSLSPERAVVEISKRKAKSIAEMVKDENAFIISADTVVSVDGEIIGKPKDTEDAKSILHKLSARTHYVFTGFTICTHGKMYSESVKTEVDFRHLTDDEIELYVDSHEPDDKAGAYAIQERGAVFVKEIRGDYYNVIGLPICRLCEAAKSEFDIILESF